MRSNDSIWMVVFLVPVTIEVVWVDDAEGHFRLRSIQRHRSRFTRSRRWR